MAVTLGGALIEEYAYSSGRISWLLSHWAEVCTLASSPTTAAGLVTSGPTPESPRIYQAKGHHSNSMRWVDVKLDVERAAGQLTGYSLEWYAVQARIQRWSLAKLAERTGWRRSDVQAAYERAVEQMVVVLNQESAGDGFAVVSIRPKLHRCEAVGCINEVGWRARFCSPQCRLRSWRAGKH